GIVRLDALPEAPLALIADLVGPEALERLPERQTEQILGVAVPLIRVAPFEASAAAKLRLALRAFTAPGLPAMVGK
ncbi:MAG: serine/threonine protein kinase, partial [Stellaceae bacterium]